VTSGAFTLDLEAAAFDALADVVYVPVRHHSPACARQVGRLIRAHRPDVVLIEGPRDATPLLPLLLSGKARMPLAIFATYAEPSGEGPPVRHGSYYPLCDYSPELAAVRAAADVGAACEFIDLTFPEMVEAGRRRADAKPQSLLNDRHFRHAKYIEAACRRVGARDHDDLWDTLFECGGEQLEPTDFFRGVLTYCAASRHGANDDELEADATLPRERAMAAAIKKRAGQRLVVVTGGFHTVALPTTEPKMPPPVKTKPDDAVVTLMRYGFEQLDRLNGYASGMPAPHFYQHLWDGGDVATLYVDLGRRVRTKQGGASMADLIAATAQCQSLADLRRHPTPTREDFLDGVRSALVKGEADAEGAVVLGLARQLLAGDRIGRVPPEAGQPAIVRDFHAVAESLGLDADKPKAGETRLDLYRQAKHRRISRFLHQLAFLRVPFAELLAGPDFVAGTELGRIQETWRATWTPGVESRLIECSLYGGTVEEAAVGRLVERYREVERDTAGGRAAQAAALVFAACQMGLHGHAVDLLKRTREIVVGEAEFAALVEATERLLVLQVAAEPLEAHDLTGVKDVASAAYERACYLLPGLAGTAEAAEADVLGALNGLSHAAATLGDDATRQRLRHAGLHALADDGTPTMSGAAIGLLFGDGVRSEAELTDAFAGRLHEPASAAGFLRGLLATARAALWQVPRLIADLHILLETSGQDEFTRQLPLLRLAFSGLTPRETDRLAKAVAEHAGGVVELRVPMDLTPDDLAHAAALDARVRGTLEADGLLAMIGGDDA
jgi:hypothetical protein